MPDSPSDYIDTRPHCPSEQLDSSGFTNTAGASDKDGDKVLDPVSLGIAQANRFTGNHLERRAREEEVGVHGIDGRTVSTTQSGAESGMYWLY